MSKLLVNPEVVVKRMQLHSVVANQAAEAIESAIRGAQAHVEAYVLSGLQKTTWKETFYVDKDAFSGIMADGAYKLRLNNGWLRAVPTITMASGLFDDPLPFEGKSKVDLIKGLVLMDSSAADQYVTIEYSHGFDEYSAEAGAGVVLIPDWLEEAICSMAPLQMAGQVTPSDDDVENAGKLGGGLGENAAGPYVRLWGFTFRPVAVEQVAA